MTKDANHNTPAEADVRAAFSEILSYEDDLLSERGSYMKTCQGIRSQIADVYDSAKQKGITKKVLKAAIKEHGLRRKVEACRADLEADEQHEYDMLREKLGPLAGLPLGEAALKGSGNSKGAETLESLGQ